MNRSSYYKNFNRIKYFFVIIIINIVIGIAFSLLEFLIKSLWDSTEFLFYLKWIVLFSYGISISFSLYSSYILLEEIKYRKKFDNITNFGKSTIQTIKFRSSIKKNINKDISEQRDMIIENFNRSVTKSIVDIHNDRIILIIYIPKTIWAKQLLDESLQDIRETISSYNPGWYFSSPIKENQHYVISGRKNYN